MKTKTLRNSFSRGGLTLVLLGGAGLMLGCGSRSESFDSLAETSGIPIGLSGAVAFFDGDLSRMMFVRSPKKGELSVSAHPVGENVVPKGIVPSPDNKRLFVLDPGSIDQTQADKTKASLTIFDGDADEDAPVHMELPTGMDSLYLDKSGEWLAAVNTSAFVTTDGSFFFVNLENGNLSKKQPTGTSKAIRIFGSQVIGAEFTPKLLVASGEKRFFAVRTERDVTLVDLTDLSRPEVTLPLPKSVGGTAYKPVQLAFDDGDPDDDSDARMAIRLEGTSDLVMIQLGAPNANSGDFGVEVNIINVGGVPSEVRFVRTDGGLRLAALVPTQQKAILVDPETTAVEEVDLGASYSQMRRITDSVETLPDGGDVALLWGDSQTVAFWALGSTSGTPYSSIEPIALDVSVKEVLDVPDDKGHGHLKLLVGKDASTFYGLNLKTHVATPFLTSGAGVDVKVSPDGGRLWAYRSQETRFAHVDLTNLASQELQVNPAVSGMFDIEGKAGRALIITHGAFDLTLMDAYKPVSSESRHFSFLQLKDVK